MIGKVWENTTLKYHMVIASILASIVNYPRSAYFVDYLEGSRAAGDEIEHGPRRQAGAASPRPEGRSAECLSSDRR